MADAARCYYSLFYFRHFAGYFMLMATLLIFSIIFAFADAIIFASDFHLRFTAIISFAIIDAAIFRLRRAFTYCLYFDAAMLPLRLLIIFAMPC